MPSINVSMHVADTLKYNHLLNRDPRTITGHSHNLYELIYVLGGDATHVIEDKKYKLKSGDLIITRPSKYHLIQIDSTVDYERHNILFDHKKLGIDMSMLPHELDVINVKDGSIISDIFKKMDYYCRSFSTESFVEIAKLLIQEIIYNLSLVDNREKEESSVINPLLSRALSYIAQNLFTIKDIAEIAGEVFVTESYLFRLFKRELFKSPKKYITEKRLLYAQNQLKKGKSPTEVASICGFEDYTTFYRNYLSMFGKSPSDERTAK